MTPNLTQLREYLHNMGYTQDSIAEMVGTTKGYVNHLLTGRKSFGKNTAMKWSDLFGISYTWLLTGEGSMLNEEKHEDNTMSLPLIPRDAMAGVLSGDGSAIMAYECERYIVPIFKGAEFLIMVQGDSMMPRYISGDIVACKRVPMDKLWFQWGKTYVIDTNQGALVKRIEPSDKEGYISVCSYNEQYKPFNLPVSEINGIALVVGTIRVD